MTFLSSTRYLPTVLLVVFTISVGFCFYLFQGSPENITDLCYKSESFEVRIKACGEILRNSSERYEQLTKEINTNSIVASGARNQIIRARDEFYKATLSGLNVDF